MLKGVNLLGPPDQWIQRGTSVDSISGAMKCTHGLNTESIPKLNVKANIIGKIQISRGVSLFCNNDIPRVKSNPNLDHSEIHSYNMKCNKYN